MKLAWGRPSRPVLSRGSLIGPRRVERLAVSAHRTLARTVAEGAFGQVPCGSRRGPASTRSPAGTALSGGSVIARRLPERLVSMDFVKSDRRPRRSGFVRTCPELVIVDEPTPALTATEGRGGRHQPARDGLAVDRGSDRHVIFVTATPTAARKEWLFRSPAAVAEPGGGSSRGCLTSLTALRRMRPSGGGWRQHCRPTPARRSPALPGDGDPPSHRLEVKRRYYMSAAYKALLDRVLRYCRQTSPMPRATSIANGSAGGGGVGAVAGSVASSPGRRPSLRPQPDPRLESDSCGRRPTRSAGKTVLDIEVEDQIEGVDVLPEPTRETTWARPTRAAAACWRWRVRQSNSGHSDPKL